MPTLGLETHIVDQAVYDNSLHAFQKAGITLPRFKELADPFLIGESVQSRLAGIDRDQAHPLNLFRIHWHNTADGTPLRHVPDHIVLPHALTGVAAKIVVLPADRFPMIRAHKVLASYGCLAPRLITGQFDPGRHRAVWPSTGNYCRGGVAVSKILGCRGVAVLPEGMSAERFRWLEEWVSDPADIIRTPGTESNVKEIYDKCAELDADPDNIIFNQFSEFGNYLVHYLCTGRAAGRVFESLLGDTPDLRLRAFVAATGSAGTLAAGDRLKKDYGSLTVAVEALECPTLLYNGFGEHNIQGIGDKHIPLIHNAMATDVVTAVSDRSTDALNVLFNCDNGKSYLSQRRAVAEELVRQLGRFGLSSICNVLAAIKTAKYYDMDDRDVILTVATDSAELYGSEAAKTLDREFPRGFDAIAAAETFGQHLLGTGTDHLQELSRTDRLRLFNLGYFTWVEQQGVSLEDFVARRRPEFWDDLLDLIPVWDEMIEKFNRDSGVGKGD